MPQTRESIRGEIVTKLTCPRAVDRSFQCPDCYRSDGIPQDATERIVQGVLGIQKGFGPILPCERMNLILPSLQLLIVEYKQIT